MNMALSSEIPPEASPFLDEWLGGENWSASALRGDASVRGYYRVSDESGRTYMVAYYPQQLRGAVPRFLKAYEALAPFARIPEVIRHCDLAVAQLDVGDDTLFDLLHRDAGEGIRFYQKAIELLVDLQRAETGARTLNPSFDEEKFLEEMEMTNQFFVRELMGGTAWTVTMVHRAYERLATQLVHHPYVLCHRDYHGQNIHLFSNELYIIDYQDMRMGPDTYDLASLLRDRGVARLLGETEEKRMVTHYAQLTSAHLDIRHRYFETLLQRSIKILGTFARQALTRGRDHYLEFIPATLESVRFCLGHLPEYEELVAHFPLDYPPSR